MSEVRIGIIGVGNIGSAHADCISKGRVQGLRLTALCDINPQRREMLKKQYPEIPVFATHQELLMSGLTDAIIVSTPHYDHPPIAVDGLRAGQHVLSEKPAAVFTRASRAVIEAAAESGKTYGIMFNQRTDPLFMKAREIVKGGMLGQIKRSVWIITNWYRTQEYYDSGSWRATWSGEGGGVLLNQAPHNLDLWQWICGMPVRIRAFCQEGKYHRISVEDDCTIYAEYENGATGMFITTTGEYPGTNRLEIAGDLGKMVLENGKLTWWRLSKPERQYCFEKGMPAPELEKQVFEYEEDRGLSGHQAILQNFTNHILHGEALISPGADGLKELSISNAAYLSSWKDEWASVPVDEAAFEKELGARVNAEKRERGEMFTEEKLSEDYRERWSVRW